MLNDPDDIFNDQLAISERIELLLSLLTPEEKVSQMCHQSPAIPRLGIDEYNWWNECLHGVARAGIATVFPQAIGLAATFDEDLLHRVASAISDEARAKHHDFARQNRREIYQGLTYWTPNINIFRDPRWGRGQETYGEDPVLTGKLAVQFVKGLQGNHEKYLKLVATPKHFAVHSGPESSRHEFDAHPSKRDLNETYFPAFEACVKEANARSVMGAYNRLYGEACCASPFLLSKKLREEWGFEGYTVSDCMALIDIYAHHKIAKSPAEAAALAIRSGLDLNCGEVYCDLVEALKMGLISEDEINTALGRLLRARFQLGMFDRNDTNPYAKIQNSVVDCDKHKDLALESALKSIVLLKNKDNILPLKRDYKRIAVIGPYAADEEVCLGNYHGTPSKTITLFEGIKQSVPEDCEVVYEQGCPVAKGLSSLVPVPADYLYVDKDKKEKGLRMQVYDNTSFEDNPVLVKKVKDLNYNCSEKYNISPLEKAKISIRWEGYIVPPKTGSYELGVDGMYSVKFWFEGIMMEDFTNIYEPEKVYFTFELEAGKPYHVKIEMYAPPGDVYKQKLIWTIPDPDMETKALETIKNSDLVILNLGLSTMLEGEEHRVHIEGFNKGDREHLDLPDVQESFLRKVHETGKPVVLVLYSGSALSVNFAQENMDGIVLAWYAGQAAGKAIADILFGKVCPSGKLPVTFYKSVNDLPSFEDYSMDNRTYRFSRVEALYPFGFGLSYSSFSYSDITLDKEILVSGETIHASIVVKNRGKIEAEEVIQLFIKDLEASVRVPLCSLKDFQRISLKPGEEKQVHFTISPKMMEIYDDDGNGFIESGYFKLFIGSCPPIERCISLGAEKWAEKSFHVK
ncbi:MAG: glycoside hydrolase family 3 C-terminal domain-containing protein [Bacteroidota bacterium]